MNAGQDVGGGEGATGALQRSFAGAGSPVCAGAGDGEVGEGGGGSLLQTLEKEAGFSGSKVGGEIGKGSGGGRGEEPNVRGWLFGWCRKKIEDMA